MRILFLGELEDYARSYQRFRALSDLGHQVTGLSMVPAGHRPVGKGPLIQRVFGKLGRPLDPARVNRGLITAVERAAFDLVWVEKGLMIRPSTLREVKQLRPSIVLVSYTEDDMYAPHNQSVYYRSALRLYDIVFTTKSYNCNLEELPALGARRVVFVDKAYDRWVHRPLEVSAETQKALGADVGFIGTYEDSRAYKLLLLAEAGYSVRVWGNGWGKWVGRHRRLRVENRPIYGDDYVRALCATKINLCFLRKANRDLQTDRTMEIPGCGAFMLAERTAEHQRLFVEDKEAAFFDIDNERELLAKVDYYLAHDSERRAIALAGRQRCLTSGYSHHDRLKHMMLACGDDA